PGPGKTEAAPADGTTAPVRERRLTGEDKDPDGLRLSSLSFLVTLLAVRRSARIPWQAAASATSSRSGRWPALVPKPDHPTPAGNALTAGFPLQLGEATDVRGS